jgi:hypothetical protein
MEGPYSNRREYITKSHTDIRWSASQAAKRQDFASQHSTLSVLLARRQNSPISYNRDDIRLRFLFIHVIPNVNLSPYLILLAGVEECFFVQLLQARNVAKKCALAAGSSTIVIPIRTLATFYELFHSKSASSGSERANLSRNLQN